MAKLKLQQGSYPKSLYKLAEGANAETQALYASQPHLFPRV
jgi:hypothetical protein